MAKLHHSHAGLLLIRNKRQIMIPLTKDVTTIGRKLADIILDDPKVSSTHCEIRREGQRFVLIDLKSTNGTCVNRNAVNKQNLVDQDVIEVGSSTLCFFEDLREFHGSAEETTAGMRIKEDSVSQRVPEGLTTTRTMAQPFLTLEIVKGPNAGKKYKFKKAHITIGRNDTDLVLVDLDISRAHCMIEVLGPQAIFLKDMGSTNGTFFQGKKVQTEKILPGAEFTLGNTTIKVHLDGGEG
jgi:pSer/pThr/pTyr-binding forkhead associated (FHA) protein